MKIGNLEIPGMAVLAPMAGVTDLPFRQICSEQGSALQYTEMISAKALYYKNKNTVPLLAVSDNCGPTVLQLFGDDPELMAEEALKLEDGPYVAFDINMGCPMPKVVNNNEGSALMQDPELAGKIIRTMSGKLKKPVTVKIRKGFCEDQVNAVLLAKIAEDSGASAIAVHGRTREQYYHGKADYDIIRQVKEAVKIPVIGSGDIFSAEDAGRMIRETGVDAVMAARGARGNPWIFREINAYLSGEPIPERPDTSAVRDMIERHTKLLYDFICSTDLTRERSDRKKKMSPESVTVHEMRAHVCWYSQGLPKASEIRRRINTAETFDEYYKILTSWDA